jgi:hypothetical protein
MAGATTSGASTSTTKDLDSSALDDYLRLKHQLRIQEQKLAGNCLDALMMALKEPILAALDKNGTNAVAIESGSQPVYIRRVLKRTLPPITGSLALDSIRKAQIDEESMKNMHRRLKSRANYQQRSEAKRVKLMTSTKEQSATDAATDATTGADAAPDPDVDAAPEEEDDGTAAPIRGRASAMYERLKEDNASLDVSRLLEEVSRADDSATFVASASGSSISHEELREVMHRPKPLDGTLATGSGTGIGTAGKEGTRSRGRPSAREIDRASRLCVRRSSKPLSSST